MGSVQRSIKKWAYLLWLCSLCLWLMATETSVKTVGVVEGTVCGICHASCPEPEVLPCSHCYCRHCIHQVALRAGVIRPFPCPECATPTILPTAFFVRAMKEREFRSRGMALPESSQDEATQDKKMMVSGSSQNCTRHKKPLEWYCFDCKVFICHACTAKDHRDHNFEFTSIAAEATKKMLRQQLESLVEIKTLLLHAVESIQMTRLAIEDQGQSVADNIESSFEELLKVINNRKQELLQQAILTVVQKCKNLSEQEKGLSTSYASVQSTIDHTEQCVTHSSDDEILHMHAEIQSRIRKIEEQQKEWKYLEPVEEVVDLGVEVNCAEDLKQLCQTKVKITRLHIDATKCAVIGEDLKSAEVKKPSQFEVIPLLSNGRAPKQACVVACSLKSLADDSIAQCQVEPIEGNKYRIQYTPTVRGRHELIVTVNGQKVACSPFPVFVSIHPTLLGKPVRVITVDSPWDVAVSATGNIITTLFSGKGVLFDKSGKTLRTLRNSKFGITDPGGVAVDNTDGCVYINGWGNKIVKLSPDFELVGKLTGQKGARYRCMAVVGGEVMVTERSKNVVMVYTKDLKYVRQFGSHGDGPRQFKDIQGVSSGETGNLYVSDHSRGCVHAFSNGGEFLHSFGQGGDGVKLRDPVGVCVVGQYVYVASYCDHCVSVFTTEGEYVTSFGKCGCGEGDFIYPWGMCVDKDGYVYVCDTRNNRIQIF